MAYCYSGDSRPAVAYWRPPADEQNSEHVIILVCEDHAKHAARDKAARVRPLKGA